MLAWREEYSTGVKEIDEQHKTLFQYINDLEEVITEKRSTGYVKVILEFLEDYAEAHFAYEEICMTERHCPVAAENKTAHDKFLDAYQAFQKRYDSGEQSIELLQEIHTMMHTWIVNHICKIDVHLRECQKGQGL